MSFNKNTSIERIRTAIEQTSKIEISDLVRETDLTSLPLNKAYRVDGVHIYVAILNTGALLESDKVESERGHQRLLRWLDVYQRVAHLELFAKSDAVKVDFQNERLHFIVYKPYDDEKKRIEHAIAVAAVLRLALEAANELHAEIPNARVTVGIESGKALAVNNGTKGDREPLFLGSPANYAAKLLTKPGIHLGENARRVIGWSGAASEELSAGRVEQCVMAAKLPFGAEDLSKAWKEELIAYPLSEIAFSRPTPPLSSLDFSQLSPASCKRFEAAYVFADVDGFTKFVDNAIANGREAEAVQIFHVIRKELRDVLSADYGGRKVRYVGDCMQGAVLEGTSQTTDMQATVTLAVLAAAAMRDAFALVQDALPGSKTLGLAIGIELGPVSLTRLGVRGSRDRCAIGRAVVIAEEMQKRCSGTETRLGSNALKHASDGVKATFPNGQRADARFGVVVATMRDAGESLTRFGVPQPAPVIRPGRAHGKW